MKAIYFCYFGHPRQSGGRVCLSIFAGEGVDVYISSYIGPYCAIPVSIRN